MGIGTYFFNGHLILKLCCSEHCYFPVTSVLFFQGKILVTNKMNCLDGSSFLMGVLTEYRGMKSLCYSVIALIVEIWFLSVSF